MGSHDAVVMKFAHATKQILWATYIGGTEAADDFDDQGIDQATDIAVYKGNNSDYNYAFVTGSTGCNDFYATALTGTPFENAVTNAWSSTSDMIHAAFMIALRQSNGLLDWSHTLGAGENGFWTADGMGVDVDDLGRLAWVGRLSQVFPSASFDFPFATPGGADTQAQGGGYFIYFSTDYQYEWATPFGSQCTNCGAYDVVLSNYGAVPKAFFTGTASTSEGDPYTYTLAVTAPQGFNGFYQPAYGGGFTDGYFASFDLVSHSNTYCTRWGGSGEEAGTSVAVIDKHVWVAGGTTSGTLPTGGLPGSGGIHEDSGAGGVDGYILDFNFTDAAAPLLVWGTLYGGPANDIVLDVTNAYNCENNNDCDLYVVGETTSATGMLFVANPVLYRQEVLGNLGGQYNRDGFLLGLRSVSREGFWSTYYGGAKTDKIWGVASSPTELYLVGGARSEQGYFPLKEWDLNSNLDWYDDDIFNNTNGSDGWYAFNSQYFRTTYMANQNEAYGSWTHDGFIASFATPVNVGFGPVADAVNVALAYRLLEEGLWSVSLPSGSSMQLMDMKGAQVWRRTAGNTERTLVDLRGQAPGIYLLCALYPDGSAHSIKLFR